ncbi:unnamed protein product [Adineta ricciae]|uniref:Uncharacterized protein n=1 Tax=Adineta ricciae TaxID=249248 RepID=A0A814HHP3_ADIRI|nr:unnamed protein product [Adineta ricciae]
MDTLASQLELNSSRNILLCLSQYSACLAAGCLSEKNKWRENLMNLNARISLCRTVNRSLDYVGCLSRIRKYGFGQNDSTSSSLTRLLTLTNSICDLIYYPAECLACFVNLLVDEHTCFNYRVSSISILCFQIQNTYMFSFDRNTLKLLQYRRLLLVKKWSKDKESPSPLSLKTEMYKCLLTLTNNFCFLINCVQWLAIPGFLWSGKLSTFTVGFCGTLATLCNIIKMNI